MTTGRSGMDGNMHYPEDSRDPMTVRFAPGYFTETSARGAPQRWTDGDNVRFHNGEPEKVGGWISETITGDVHTGVARRMHEWVSLDGEKWIAYGTNTKLYLLNRDVRYNITPIARTINLTNPFTTVNGSADVTVHDVGNSANAGDSVTFSGASTFAGITIDGEYIVGVVTGDSYVITHTAPANASTTGGGTVHAVYELSVGSADQDLALGWGVGTWGQSTWGTARDVSTSHVIRRLRIWSLDNFGEDLIASPRGGAVYHWDRTNGTGTRAQVLDQAPLSNQRVLISNSGGQIVCLGAFDSVANASDPMLIRVGAEESFTDFTVSDQSTAFDERLGTGSEIITGVRTRSGIFVSTDEAFYFMQPDSFAIFNVQQLSEGGGALSPNAVIEVDGTIFAMTRSKFMVFDGVVQELVCDVWQYVFVTRGISVAQSDKVYAWYNEQFSEIYWMFPSRDSNEIDTYVVYNKKDRVWYYGTISRTAAIPPGPSYHFPVAIDPSGTLFTHENGKGDNGLPMNWHITSHDFELGNGKQTMHMSRVVMDMTRQVSDFALQIQAKKRPSGTYVVKGPYLFEPTTQQRGVRIKGRQASLILRNPDADQGFAFIAQYDGGVDQVGYAVAGVTDLTPLGTVVAQDILNITVLVAAVTLDSGSDEVLLILKSDTPLAADLFTTLRIYDADRSTVRVELASTDADFSTGGDIYPDLQTQFPDQTFAWMWTGVGDALTADDNGRTFYLSIAANGAQNTVDADFRFATATLYIQPDSEE